jgi:hypothetical protein
VQAIKAIPHVMNVVTFLAMAADSMLSRFDVSFYKLSID